MKKITKEQILNASAEELKKLAGVKKNKNGTSCYNCTSCYKSKNQEVKEFVFCNIQLSEKEYFDALKKVLS